MTKTKILLAMAYANLIGMLIIGSLTRLPASTVIVGSLVMVGIMAVSEFCVLLAWEHIRKGKDAK